MASVRRDESGLVGGWFGGGGASKGQGAVALAAALTAVALVESAYAGKNVQVDHVARGTAKFDRNGSVLTIRAADRTIINYRRFDLGAGETVRFIQPSSTSRVLNRITSSVPSKIDGTVTANGVVYFVNPSGIMFGRNAVINVGHFYAAAGTITDANFLNNVNQFKTSGAVVNQGVINGDAVALIGRTVANAGTIAAEGGLVTMVAGDDVMIGTRDGHIMVKVGSASDSAASATAAPKGSVTNTGTVRTGTMALAGGDMYALAIGGSIKAKNVSAQTGGNVAVTGKIDASDSAAGAKGGNVVVTGKNVSLQGATIDASGDAGGGNVLVGGDFQGKGETPRATNTVVDNATTITASATGNGDGGNVVVWSDNKTTYNGSIYAKGGAAGGNGGQVEVSGKGHLDFNGHVDTTAPKGNVGSLLLDPHNLSIELNSPDVHGDGSNQDVSGDIGAGDDGTNDSVITAGQLVNLLNTTDVSLAATNDIHVNTMVDASGNAGSHALTLDAGHDINVNESILLNNANLTLNAGNRVYAGVNGSINVGSGDVFLTAGADVYFQDSAGFHPHISANHLTVEAGTGICNAPGSWGLDVALTGGLEAHATTGDIIIKTASIGALNLGFTGGTKGGIVADVGNVSVEHQGTIQVASSGHVVSASGDVSLQANGDIVTDNYTGPAGGGQVQAGGQVTIQAGGNVTLGQTAHGDVHAGNGLSIAALSGTVVIDNGSFIEADAGNVSVSAGTAVNLAQSLTDQAHLWNNGAGTLTVTAPSFSSDSGGIPASVQSGGSIAIVADDVSFTDAITSTADTVTFRPLTAGRGISLADSAVAGRLTLTGAELSLVTGSAVVIGDATSGNILIAGTINQPASGWNKLALVTGGAISDAAGGTLQVDALDFTAATGVTLSNQTHFIGTLNGTNSTSGGVAVTNAGDLTIGTVTATGQDVSLTTGGQLLQLSGGGIVARNATLEAANGIGTSLANLGLLLAGGLEAHATTGDIFVVSGSSLDLGFAGGTKGGVVADDGNVSVVSFGNIYARTADHPVVASGDVAITAVGSTLVTDNFSGSGAGQISAGGMVWLNGDAGVTIGQTTFGDVHAGNGLSITAITGTVTIDNGSFVETDAGDLSVSAGTGVTLAQTSTAGAHLWSGGTGPTALTITAPSFSSASGAVPAAVKSAGGIIIKADTVDFTDNVESTSSSAGDWVAFRTYTPGRGISLADAPVAGQLTLTGTQLSQVKAGYAVMIGDTDNGDISVAGTINQPASGWNKLALVTGGSVSDAAGGTLQVDELAVAADTGVTLNNQTHFVGTFEANNFTSGGIAFKNSGDLAIGTLGPIAGVHSAGTGGVDIQATGVLSITGGGADENVTSLHDVSLSGLDVVTGTGGATPDVRSDTGSVTIIASRDVILGSAGNHGDVHAATGLTIAAGRDVVIDNGSFVETDGGNISVAGNASVQLLQTSDAGAHLWNNGSGTILIDTPSFTSTSGAVRASVKGGSAITIKADTVDFTDNIESTGSGAGDWVAIRTHTAGRGISLADGPVAGQLTITGTQLSHVKAGYAVMIGDTDNGDISVAGTINQPASGWDTLCLVTGGSISDAAGGTIQVDELATYSFTGTTLNNQTHFVDTFEAFNATSGGIAFNNSGDLTIGSLGPVDGVNAATAGGVTIETTGVLSIAGGGVQTVSAAGNVYLSGQDVVTGGGATAVSSSAGSVTIDAARDVILGSAGDFGDVHAANGLTITAARDVLIDEGSVVQADAGNASVSGGSSVQIQQTNTPGAQLLNNGAGTLTISAPSFVSASGGIPASVQSGGAIVIAADDVSFSDAIASTSDSVTFRTFTAGRGISLADADVAGQLTLTGTELSLVSGTKVVIGSATAGNISVAGTINQPASGWDTLHLITGGSVSDAAGGTLQVDNLAVEAVTGITLGNQTHLIGTFAADNSTSGGVSLASGAPLTVGTVDGLTGITGGGNVTLATDALDITEGIDAGTGVVTLKPLSAGTDIDLGSEVVGKLSLTVAELDLVTASVLRIGSASAGDINVSNADSSSAGWNVLHLISGGDIGETGTITVGSLAAQAAGSIELGFNNTIDTVAASAGTTFTLRSTNDLLVDTVDGVSGISSNGLTQVASDLSLTVNKNVTVGSGAGHILILTTDTGVTQTGGSVTADALAVYSVTSGDITLGQAGNNVGAFAADSAGAVTFRNDGSFAVDNVNGITGIGANGDVTLTIDHTGDLTVAQPVVTNGGDFTATVSAGGFSATSPDGTIDTHGANAGDSAGNITITASGAVSIANDLDVTGNANASGNGGKGGNVTISGSSVSLRAVNTSGGNSTSVGDDGGSAGDISVTSTGATTLNGNLTAAAGTGDTGGSSGDVGLHGPVVLGTDLTITAHDVTLGSTVRSTTDGIQGLTIASDSAGTVTLGGAVGNGGKKLEYLIVNGTAATLLNGGSVATSGNQTYTGPVTLGADTTLTSGGVVTFNKTVRGATSGADSLTITATTGTTFHGAVGDGGKALEFLSVTGPVDLNGGSVTTAAGQAYAGAVTLSDDTTLTGTTITFAGTVDGDSGGPYDLTLHNSGLATFGGAVGAGGHVHDLLVDGPVAINGGSVRTTGLQSYFGAATLGANATLAGTAITFGSTLNGTTAGGQSLAVVNTGLLTFNGTVGNANKLSSLTVDGATRLNGSVVSTTGDQHYKSAVTLAKDAALAATNITFDSTVGGTTNGAEGLAIVNSGTVTFKADVGTSALRLASLAITGATTIDTAGAASVFTAGTQHYAGAFATKANLTLTGSAVTFGSTVRGLTSGGQSLAINGATTFNGAVGDAGKALSTLTLGGPATLNGGSVTTTGDQSYAGPVTVASNATLTGNSISFASTVNGLADGGQSLTLANSGPATFAGAVGDTARLSSLTVNGASAINGGSVRTTGAQSYTGPATLGADTTLTATAVTFGSTLNGTTAGGQGLTLHNSAVATFNGAVGGINSLKFLTIDGPTSMNAGTVTTTGAQSYGGELTLVRNATLTASQVTLAKVTGGSSNLTISGPATFNGTVAAGNLAVSGAAAINGGSVTTSGTQTYSGPATLGANTTLTGSTVTFAQSLDAASAGNQSLTLNGHAKFQGPVGATASLKTLTVNGVSDFGGGNSVVTKGNQLYNGVVNVTGSGATFHAGSYNGTQLASPGTVTFKKDLNASGAVVVYGATGITFNGNVTGNDAASDTLTLQVPWIDPKTPAVVQFAAANGPTRVRNLSKLAIENPLGNRGVPQVATVAVTSAQGIVIEVTDAFTMQRNQKMTAAADGASITIDVANGTASIGDLNAPGDINVHASKIELMARAPGQVVARNSGGTAVTTTDSGLDFVAGGGINFTGNTSVNSAGLGAGPHKVTFSFRDNPPAAGVVSQINGALLLVLPRPVDPALLTLNGTVLDLPPTGTSPVNPSAIRAGVTQVHVVEPGKEPGISDAAKSFLADIGVRTRDLTQAELIEGLDGRDMYVQAPEPLLQVALPRLNEQLVVDALNLYTTLFATEGGPTNPAEVKATVKETLTKALDAYKVASGTTGDNVDPIAFRHFVESSSDHKQALAHINRLRSFLIQLELLSLTTKELADARDTVCREVAPTGLPLHTFETAILGKATPATH